MMSMHDLVILCSISYFHNVHPLQFDLFVIVYGSPHLLTVHGVQSVRD